ncbi:MAG: SpaH/EbpB family LPXTG-anchored major pilin, partial [Clostridia bacterium]|nr:SpaH/EbpB family LPXTG-anchored major pilin [Clostridia bacterium]
INVHAGAENYVLHDIFSEGLTFDQVTKVELISNGVTSDVTAYTVETEDLDDNCTLEVRFTKDFCDTLETNDKLIIYYQAMLNRNAVIAGAGNPNEAWLEYGEEHYTTHDTTTTYTFGFDIVKTDSQNTLIDGAEFKIYDAAAGGNEVKVVLMDDGVTYRRARADEEGVDIIVKDGKVRVVGFDNGTYYLEETVAPQGYNKLVARQRFIISDANLDSVFNGEIFSTGSGVHVVNKTGSMLPETGGIGTTIFVALGAIAVLGAGVLLFAKKRMSQIAE